MNRNLARTAALGITLLASNAITGRTASQAGNDPEHAFRSEWEARKPQ